MKGNLVVICSLEEENQSYLALVLYPFKINPREPEANIKDILINAFLAEYDSTKGEEAICGAEVDDDRYFR